MTLTKAYWYDDILQQCNTIVQPDIESLSKPVFKNIQGTFHANKCKEQQTFIIIIENFSTFIGILQIFETKYVTGIPESAMKFEQKNKNESVYYLSCLKWYNKI